MYAIVQFWLMFIILRQFGILHLGILDLMDPI